MPQDRLFFPKKWLVVLTLLLSCLLNGSIDAESARSKKAIVPTLDQIRQEDYVEYSRITLEFNNTVRCSVSADSKSILTVRLPGAIPGKFTDDRAFDSPAYKKIAFTTDPKTKTLIATVPLSSNVDSKRIFWHNWGNMVTIDLPLKTPNHAYVPSKDAIIYAQNRGVKVVVIDPGHGGWNTNATGSKYCRAPHLHESEVVLDIAWRLYNQLKKDSRFLPVMTRYGDYLPVPFGAKGSSRAQHKKISLLHRVVLGQQYKGDVFISLHMNAAPRNPRGARGFEIYHFGAYGQANLQWDLQNKDLDELEAVGIDYSSELSRMVTNIKLQQRLEQSQDVSSSIVSEIKKIKTLVLRPKTQIPFRNFTVIRHLNMPSVLVEMGFLTHPSDHELFRRTATRDQMATALHNSMINYFFQGKPLKPSTESSTALIAMDQLLKELKVDIPYEPSTNSENVGADQVESGEADFQPGEIGGDAQIQPLENAPVDAAEQNDLALEPMADSSESPLPMVQPLAQTHLVRKGEVVGDIAKLYGTSARALRDLNPKMGRRYVIHPGDELRLPAGVESLQPDAPLPNALPEIITYKVRPGDSLDKIATEFNTTVESLKELNNKRRSLIYPGDALQVQPNTKNASKSYDEPKYIVYSVRRGDSLWEIARKFSISVAGLKQMNNLSSNSIQPGVKLRVPG